MNYMVKLELRKLLREIRKAETKKKSDETWSEFYGMCKALYFSDLITTNDYKILCKLALNASNTNYTNNYYNKEYFK